MATGGTVNARPESGSPSSSVHGASVRDLGRLTLAVTLLAVLAIGMREVIDPDLWWHMATGRYIVAHGGVPTVDVFSFTASGQRWVTHEWLSDLLLYGGYRLAGLPGLGVLFGLIVAAAYALVYRRCRSEGALAGCSVLLAALAASPSYGARPQMFSLFFSSLFLYLLSSPRTTERRLWLLVPLTLLWANLHSGFVAGLAIIGVHAVGEEIAWLGQRGGEGPWVGPKARQLALVLLACVGASLVTPNGVAGVAFPFGTLGSQVIQDTIQEWASPDFHKSMAWPLGAYWLALLGALAVSRRRLGASELLLLLGSSATALYSVRHAQFLSLVGAPILAEGLTDLMGRRARAGADRQLPKPLLAGMGVVTAALLLVVAVRTQGMVRRTAEAESALYPASALAYMREHDIGGRVFNTYHWGGYLIWQGYPVFVDGRAEVYGDRVLGEHVKARWLKPDWEEPLRHYGVEVVLIETDSPLAVVLRESGRWQAVYRDDLATVFVPDGSAQDAL